MGLRLGPDGSPLAAGVHPQVFKAREWMVWIWVLKLARAVAWQLTQREQRQEAGEAVATTSEERG